MNSFLYHGSKSRRGLESFYHGFILCLAFMGQKQGILSTLIRRQVWAARHHDSTPTGSKECSHGVEGGEGY